MSVFRYINTKRFLFMLEPTVQCLCLKRIMHDPRKALYGHRYTLSVSAANGNTINQAGQKRAAWKSAPDLLAADRMDPPGTSASRQGFGRPPWSDIHATAINKTSFPEGSGCLNPSGRELWGVRGRMGRCEGAQLCPWWPMTARTMATTSSWKAGQKLLFEVHDPAAVRKQEMATYYRPTRETGVGRGFEPFELDYEFVYMTLARRADIDRAPPASLQLPPPLISLAAGRHAPAGGRTADVHARNRAGWHVREPATLEVPAGRFHRLNSSAESNEPGGIREHSVAQGKESVGPGGESPLWSSPFPARRISLLLAFASVKGTLSSSQGMAVATHGTGSICCLTRASKRCWWWVSCIPGCAEGKRRLNYLLGQRCGRLAL